VKKFFTAGLVIFSILTVAGPLKAEIKVVEAAISTSIANLSPVGAGESFPSTIGRLFCYSRIEGGKIGSMITHRWYYNDSLMAVIPLEIKSAESFRTYSSKKILPSWKGKWRIEIKDSNGALLKDIPFTVE